MISTLFSPIVQLLPWLIHYLTPLYKYYHDQYTIYPHCTTITMANTLPNHIVQVLT